MIHKGKQNVQYIIIDAQDLGVVGLSLSCVFQIQELRERSRRLSQPAEFERRASNNLEFLQCASPPLQNPSLLFCLDGENFIDLIQQKEPRLGISNLFGSIIKRFLTPCSISVYFFLNLLITQSLQKQVSVMRKPLD